AGAVARNAHARLVLVARSADPGSHPPGVRALEDAGAEVLLLRADVGSVRDMQDVIAKTVARFGDIHGIVHAAGVTSEDPTLTTIAEIDRPSCDVQFHGKLRGVLAIEEAIRDRDLDFVLMTSSLASTLGGVGFAAYSAANLFMDAFAQAQAAS